MLIFIGCLFLATAGAILHDVPFLRFLSATLLMSVGQMFLVLGMK